MECYRSLRRIVRPHRPTPLLAIHKQIILLPVRNRPACRIEAQVGTKLVWYGSHICTTLCMLPYPCHHRLLDVFAIQSVRWPCNISSEPHHHPPTPALDRTAYVCKCHTEDGWVSFSTLAFHSRDSPQIFRSWLALFMLPEHAKTNKRAHATNYSTQHSPTNFQVPHHINGVNEKTLAGALDAWHVFSAMQNMCILTDKQQRTKGGTLSVACH